jgi:hypothetical protein
MQATYTTCIESDNAVPADLGPQCRLERQDRHGSQIAWSMSCANTGVRADGRAQYRGDTMQATVVSHIPAAAGGITDMTQHLTGRLLGPCLPATAAFAPTAASLPSNGVGGSQPSPAEPGSPPAQSAGRTTRDLAPPAPISEAKAETAPAAAPPEVETRRRHMRHGRHAQRSHRRHHGGSAYRAFYGGGSSFGPRPTSGAGP